MTAAFDPHQDYVRAGLRWHPRRPVAQSIDVIAVIWRDLWHSLAGALASELVMERAIATGNSDLRWTAWEARGISRVGYGAVSDWTREQAADKCLLEADRIFATQRAAQHRSASQGQAELAAAPLGSAEHTNPDQTKVL